MEFDSCAAVLTCETRPRLDVVRACWSGTGPRRRASPWPRGGARRACGRSGAVARGRRRRPRRGGVRRTPSWPRSAATRRRARARRPGIPLLGQQDLWLFQRGQPLKTRTACPGSCSGDGLGSEVSVRSRNHPRSQSAGSQTLACFDTLAVINFFAQLRRRRTRPERDAIDAAPGQLMGTMRLLMMLGVARATYPGPHRGYRGMPGDGAH